MNTHASLRRGTTEPGAAVSRGYVQGLKSRHKQLGGAARCVGQARRGSAMRLHLHLHLHLHLRHSGRPHARSPAKFTGLVDVNYLDRSATTILAGGSGE